MLTLCAHSREFFDLVKLKEIVCAHGLKALRECLKPALDTDPLVVVPARPKVPAGPCRNSRAARTDSSERTKAIITVADAQVSGVGQRERARLGA